MPTQTLSEWSEGRDWRQAEAAVAVAFGVETEPLPDPVVLMERDYAGLRVELRLVHGDTPALLVQIGEEPPVGLLVPPAEALEAFWHPFLYLPEDVTL